MIQGEGFNCKFCLEAGRQQVDQHLTSGAVRARSELPGDFLHGEWDCVFSRRLPAQFGDRFKVVLKDQVVPIFDNDIPLSGDVQMEVIPANMVDTGQDVSVRFSGEAYSPSPVSSVV